jgi:DNA polymerase-1
MNKQTAVNLAKLLKNLIKLGEATKISDTFVKAFKEGTLKKDGRRYLHGNFNQTGTKSGRLSSSDPNLTNLPSSGTQYAKPVKKGFKAPKGKLIVGADFDSLEDKISALTTKDPNKLKVYIDGFDGHSLRAYSYFKNQMEGIDPNSVESINSIQIKYKSLRQDSKMPTFLLTYGGTYIGMMEQGNFTEEQAKEIEANYHELYKVSDEWVAEKIKEASKRGYVEVAFGLKLRTPRLKRTDLNKSYTPYEAQKEARTAGNALGQSYCMLNSRAAIEFFQRVLASPYIYDIRIICLIHDAIYLMVTDDIDVVHWVNENLIECMSWQGLPEIQHDKVKISASLDIFYPSWADPISIPNNATKDEILQICKQ